MSFLLAVTFLTVIPLRRGAQYEHPALGRAMLWFPVVGLLIGGAVCGALLLAAQVLPGMLPEIVAVVFLVGLTGALHLDGLADTFDGIFGGRDRASRLRIMRDTGIGAYGLAAVPVGLAALLSFSKGALILGLPLSLLALGLLAGGRWSWATLGAVAVAAVAAVPLLRTPRFASLLDTRSGTTFFRLQLWRSSWMMFRDHLALGVGLDNFLYQYRSRYVLPAAWQEPDLSHPHNVLLDYASRLGLCGLAAGAWLQVAFWRLALPLRRMAGGSAGPAGRARNEATDRRALALGLMGSMVDFLAHGLVDASYFVIDLAFAFFLALGLVQWLARSKTDELET